MSKPKVSKNEEVELTNLLEKCTQIMKEDRNVLRTSLKENNEELLNLLRKHRKKLELPSLQIELRKILNKIKGKTPSQTSIAHSQQALEKKPQASKTNLKEKPRDPRETHEKDRLLVEKAEKSPEKKPPVAKTREKSAEKPLKIEKKPEKVEKKPEKPEKIEKKPEKTEKKPDSTEKSHEKSEKSPKIAARLEENAEKPLEKPEILEKKPKSVKNIDQIEETVRNPEKYETPSFKTQPQATFRAEKVAKVAEAAEKVEKPVETAEKPAVVAHNLRINSNENAKKFLESAKERQEIEKNVDFLLNLQDFSAFSGRKIEVFKENDEFNTADFSLPTEIAGKSGDFLENTEEKLKKNPGNLQIIADLPIQLGSPMKSESMKSQKNSVLRPSVLKSLKFITERPKFNGKIVEEMQKTMGFHELFPEFVFDQVLGDVHLSRTSRTYFMYKIQTVFEEREPPVPMKLVEKLFEICDLKQDGFIDLNEFGFSLEVLCKKTLKANAIRHIYNVFDPENTGFFNEDGFVQNLLAFNQSIGENIDEMSLRGVFSHLDEEHKGILTYWDLKKHEIMEELKELCGIAESQLQNAS